MSEIIIDGYHGEFIKKDGVCYYFAETTVDPVNDTNT
jgi:hypothetical protein